MTSNRPVELLPCPFCGSDASISDGDNGIHFRVICNKPACRAAGPLERCAIDARDAWNTRASSQAASDDPLGDGSDFGVTGEWWGQAASTDIPSVVASDAVVEKVARAMFENSEYNSIRWETATDALKEDFRKPARTAIAAIPSGVEELRWRPIETAPKDGDDILVLWRDDGAGCLVVSWDDEPDLATHHWATLDGLHYHDNAFSHWMPLPDSPESTGK